jgi:methionyl-tRNA formyltransferase
MTVAGSMYRRYMRILFMGTPVPAAKCLEALIKAGHQIVGVITQPDRPKGRGLEVTQPAVKAVALTYNIPVHQPEKIKDIKVIKEIRDIGAELIVVVAYGKIIPKEIIDAPKHGSINLHASLLPKYRGAAPIQRSIINGDSETGVTIQRVNFELDSGDIILQSSVKIDATDNITTLTKKLFDIGEPLLIEAVKLIDGGKATLTKQDASKVTFAPLLKKEEGLIDWKKSAKDIHCQIRGCDPWPVAYTYLNGRSFRIFSAEIGLGDAKYEPGKVVDCVKGEGFIIATADGTIFVKEAQLESGKRMKAWDFVIGNKIKVGDVLPS